MRNSITLERLRAGKPVMMSQVAKFATAELADLMGLLGFHCLWIDMEHKAFEMDALLNICAGARAGNVDTIVRIIKGGYTSIIRPFECGASGIMVPHVMNADEAREIVKMSRCQPIGRRAIDMVGVDADYGLMPPEEYVRRVNEETFVCIQIEDKEAVDYIEEIAEIDGIDIIFVGPADLSHSYGVFPQVNHPKVQEAIARVAKAVEGKKDKWWGCPAGTPDRARELLDMGARFLSNGSDIFMLINGFKALREEFSFMYE
jgi:4-hydroxy-2-oxoheptanedioate aldolase